jgi:hypothetical protein
MAVIILKEYGETCERVSFMYFFPDKEGKEPINNRDKDRLIQ